MAANAQPDPNFCDQNISVKTNPVFSLFQHLITYMRDKLPLCATDLALKNALKIAILSGFQKDLPYVSNIKPDDIFHSHYDYHSSIHAHWALLVLARKTEDKELSKQMRSRLSQKNIEAELSYLLNNSDVELPYGRAWFLLLLHEMRRQGMTNQAIDELGSKLEDQVIGWLKSNEEQNLSDGSYESSTMALMLLNLSQDKSASLDHRILALNKALESNAKELEKLPAGPGDFMSPKVAADVILNKDHESDSFDFPKPVSLDNCHQVGYQISELWAQSAQASHGNSEACDSLTTKFQYLEKHPEIWGSDFVTTTHWVPQFIVLAMLLSSDTQP